VASHLVLDVLRRSVSLSPVAKAQLVPLPSSRIRSTWCSAPTMTPWKWPSNFPSASRTGVVLD